MTTEEELIPEINDLYDNKSLIITPHTRKNTRSNSFKLNRSNVKEKLTGEKGSQMIEMEERTAYFDNKDEYTKEEDETKAEMDINPEPCHPYAESFDYNKTESINYMGTYAFGQDNFINERFKEEYLFRFKGMVLSIEEEKRYDINPNYIEKAYEKLPWKNKTYYDEATDFKEYNFKNCPFYTSTSNESNTILNFRVQR